MGVSQNYGYHLGGPNNTDDNILGLYWGPLIVGNYHVGWDRSILTKTLDTASGERKKPDGEALYPPRTTCSAHASPQP